MGKTLLKFYKILVFINVAAYNGQRGIFVKRTDLFPQSIVLTMNSAQRFRWVVRFAWLQRNKAVGKKLFAINFGYYVPKRNVFGLFA